MPPYDTTPIPGYPGYFITRDGRVWSECSHRPRWLILYTDNRGYKRVMLRRDRKGHFIPIHRLVLITFVGEPQPGQQVRHLNGDQLDNRADNLCWGTPRENAADRDRHGTTARGDRHFSHTSPDRLARGEEQGSAKLTEEQVREARALRAAGHTVSDLAARYGVQKAGMSKALLGRTWRHLV